MPILRPILRPLTSPLTRALTDGALGGFSPASLFAAGEQGAWYRSSDLSTLFQDSAGTTPVTATGQPVGLIRDKSGRGNHASQATATRRPVLPAAGYRLISDFTDDALATGAIAGSAGEAWVNTPYGYYRTAHSPGVTNLPLNNATEVIAREGTLTDAQRQAIARWFGTARKYMVCMSPVTVVSTLRIYSGGPSTDLTFVGANGATVTKSLSANSDSSFDVSADGLTAPVALVWADSLSANTALTNFYCYNNQLTGSIPSLSANTALVTFNCNSNQLTGSIPSLSANTALLNFYCNSNQLTGSIPSLSANTALANFICNSNQLTGSIPSLSANTALTNFYCYSNQLTDFAGGTVSSTLGDFRAQNNSLTAAAVNAILAAFVAAGRTSAAGTCVLNLGGAGNAAPTGQGLTDKSTLIARGWTVTTN